MSAWQQADNTRCYSQVLFPFGYKIHRNTSLTPGGSEALSEGTRAKICMEEINRLSCMDFRHHSILRPKKDERLDRDEIIYDDKPISPGSLANTIAVNSRKGWRDLWVKRPEDREWKLADECRSEVAIDPLVKS